MPKSISKKRKYKEGRMRGFSLIELLIVLLIVAILMVFATRFSNPILYYADRQAHLAIDILKEAKQKAISQRETMRVEINEDDRTIRIVDENKPGDASDDVEIVKRTLGDSAYVRFDKPPATQHSKPEELTPVPEIPFKKSVYPTSEGSKVATLRFLSRGKVEDAGTDAIGSGAIVTGATIYFWTARITSGTNVDKPLVMRAITVLGSSSTIRYWKCPVVNDTCTDWVK